MLEAEIGKEKKITIQERLYIHTRKKQQPIAPTFNVKFSSRLLLVSDRERVVEKNKTLLLR
jgi:hypothetical protein